MATDYEKLYQKTRHALGEPTNIFIKYFETYLISKARVLDVGCGQGRDALFIARLGHRVTGVDIAPSGIDDLIESARKENLTITGEVADLVAYNPDGQFDVVLIDRTLHMLPEGDRYAVLDRLSDHVRTGGALLIADEKSNIAGLLSVLKQSGSHWSRTYEQNGYLFLTKGDKTS